MKVEILPPVSADKTKVDPIETMRKRKDVEFELFLYLHVGCDGFSQNGNTARCETHGVNATAISKYISK